MPKPHPIVTCNGRDYPWPNTPVVVICCDGSEPEYMERAVADGLMPHLQRIIEKGENLRGHSVIPSFTNPNNMSIATGQPPAVHGICGNFLIDPQSGEAVMMNDPKFLRAPTVFSAFQKAGAKIAIVTAKDKLRLLLGDGLAFDGSAVSFSSERADQCERNTHGIDNVCNWLDRAVPDVYSAELSEFVLAAGTRLLSEMKPDLMYLSTTDYVQHKFAPGSDGANAFYIMLDQYLGALDQGGATIVLTADHGMKGKHLPDGTPDVLYLQDVMDDWLDVGAARVILPITDPYVVHHGALGSFATIYLPENVDHADLATRIGALAGIDVCLTKAEGCARFELPPDRTGDLIVVSGGPTASKVIGTSASEHDLSGLTDPLRSHGGITEQEIPIILNVRAGERPKDLRNFDAFHIGCSLAAKTT